MPQHTHRNAGLRQAIKRQIERLGLHASPADIIAALANLGMEVSAEQVERVKIQILRDQYRTEQAANDHRKTQRTQRMRRRRGLQKVPQKRPWRKR